MNNRKVLGFIAVGLVAGLALGSLGIASAANLTGSSAATSSTAPTASARPGPGGPGGPAGGVIGKPGYGGEGDIAEALAAAQRPECRRDQRAARGGNELRRDREGRGRVHRRSDRQDGRDREEGVQRRRHERPDHVGRKREGHGRHRDTTHDRDQRYLGDARARARWAWRTRRACRNAHVHGLVDRDAVTSDREEPASRARGGRTATNGSGRWMSTARCIETASPPPGILAFAERALPDIQVANTRNAWFIVSKRPMDGGSPRRRTRGRRATGRVAGRMRPPR